jgi:hypothetical protein
MKNGLEKGDAFSHCFSALLITRHEETAATRRFSTEWYTPTSRSN